MNTISNITLDLQRPNATEIVHAVQDDSETRKIKARLLNGAREWTPPEGTFFVIRYAKPDGKIGLYSETETNEEAVAVSGSEAVITLAAQAINVPGEVVMQLNMYNAEGQKLSTFCWLVVVTEAPVSDEEIVSSDYFNVLTEQITAALDGIGAKVEAATQEALNVMAGQITEALDGIDARIETAAQEAANVLTEQTNAALGEIDTKIEAVTQTAEEAKTGIEAKGQQTRNSIPDDYIKLSDSVTDISNKLSKYISMAKGNNHIKSDDAMSLGYIEIDGTEHQGAPPRGYTDFIEVSEGDIVRFYANRAGQFTGQYLLIVTAYDSDKMVLPSLGTTYVEKYTVPHGVKFVRITVDSWNVSRDAMLTLNYVATEYEPYTEPEQEVLQDLLTEETTAVINSLVTNVANLKPSADDKILLAPKVYLGVQRNTMKIEAFATSEECSYQWYMSKNGGNNWEIMSSRYRTKSIDFELTDARNGNMYKCKVTDMQNGWSYYTDAATVMIDAEATTQNLEAEA